MKIKSIELLKWLAWTTVAGYLFGYLTVYTLDSAFNKVPQSFYSIFPALCVSIAFYRFYGRQLDRLDSHLPVKEKNKLKATNARSIPVNGTHNLFLSAVPSIFSPESSVSGLLWWQYGSYTIREDTAYEWLRKGWKRQVWGNPHPFSGNWMTSQRFYTLSNQTIDRGYHEALVMLVSNYGLWLKEPRQGTAGKLLVSPTLCLEKFKGSELF